MTMIGKWALQLLALMLLGWLASVAGQWSSHIVNGTSSERLAQARPQTLLDESMTVSAVKPAADAQAR